jgi:MFS transporter, UMF1 family
VGLWWIGFAQIPLKRLPADNEAKGAMDRRLLTKGYGELRKAWKSLKRDSHTLAYLGAFFCFNAGVQAVLFLASTFAEKELHFSTTGLIFLILILQIVAIGGANFFAWVSGKRGNKFSIVVMLVVWAIICIIGYFVQTGLDFYLLAALVGLVMGGTQSMARSTYAKFLPEDTPDTASYFSFFDVMDKVSTVAGTLVFGLVEFITGNMRYSVAALAIFFLLSLLIISGVKVRRMAAIGPNT